MGAEPQGFGLFLTVFSRTQQGARWEVEQLGRELAHHGLDYPPVSQPWPLKVQILEKATKLKSSRY